MHYEKKSHQQFVADMEATGLEVEHYRGRNFYEGPSVTVGDIQEAFSNTKIPCFWDHMGLQYVVYPK